uniref:Protein EMBRYO DEFECTIVE 514-like n=1 Tax=Cicer arietinum TaxID=3827 RepID=A0A1S3E9N2_CICAR|nr:protein EMBRYO DEFECTIVE 514-like [Cicer arietinum]XP_012572537.2 protein EMBRYO DEFECTIVE 514-like [Cicer arietinum]
MLPSMENIIGLDQIHCYWGCFVWQYEHKMLLELIMKGHPEPHKKIGGEICAFQVRMHPMWKSKCFFLIREDESADDFSFRKCVDHILPLPEAMQVKHDANRALGGSGGAKRRGGRGGSRGHGRKGKSRH